MDGWMDGSSSGGRHYFCLYERVSGGYTVFWGGRLVFVWLYGERERGREREV